MGIGSMPIEMNVWCALQDTYRYHGHSISDPGVSYRTRDEVQGVRRSRDPIEHVRKILLDHEVVDADSLKQIERKVKSQVCTDILDLCCCMTG